MGDVPNTKADKVVGALDTSLKVLSLAFHITPTLHAAMSNKIRPNTPHKSHHNFLFFFCIFNDADADSKHTFYNLLLVCQ